jgi:hypothetical protein
LFSWILEKIRNWFGLIWIHYANSRKEIRKTENEKEPEQKKRERQPLGRPGNRTSPEATEPAQPGRFSPAAPLLLSLFFFPFSFC